MSGIDPTLAADALVALLLVAVIFYAALLNRRLKTWRSESAEMARLIASFGEAIARAEAALAGLKQAAREEGAQLDTARQRAQTLHADLGYMLDRGGPLADRLERSLRSGMTQPVRAPSAPQGEAAHDDPPTVAAEATAKGDRTMSAAERQLIKALEAMR